MRVMRDILSKKWIVIALLSSLSCNRMLQPVATTHTAPSTIRGVATNGEPLANGKVTVYELDSLGQVGALVGESQTDSMGTFSVEISGAPPLKVVVNPVVTTTAIHRPVARTNVALNASTDPLILVLIEDPPENILVGPLTTLVATHALKSGLDINTAISQITKTLGITNVQDRAANEALSEIVAAYAQQHDVAPNTVFQILASSAETAQRFVTSTNSLVSGSDLNESIATLPPVGLPTKSSILIDSPDIVASEEKATPSTCRGWFDTNISGKTCVRKSTITTASGLPGGACTHGANSQTCQFLTTKIGSNCPTGGQSQECGVDEIPELDPCRPLLGEICPRSNSTAGLTEQPSGNPSTDIINNNVQTSVTATSANGDPANMDSPIGSSNLIDANITHTETNPDVQASTVVPESSFQTAPSIDPSNTAVDPMAMADGTTPPPTQSISQPEVPSYMPPPSSAHLSY